MIRQLRTRLAPTPSGYLHLGNAWSFLLTWLYARKAGGYVHLRIDDIDPERYRDAYAEDIFTSLKWLGLDHDGGPATVSDFFSQRRTPATTRRHHAALDALCDVQSGAQSDAHSESAAYLFECHCSRERIKRDLAAKNQALHFHQMNAIYPGTCRHRRMQRQDLWPGETDISVLRWHLPESTEVLVHDLHLGDIILFPWCARAPGALPITSLLLPTTKPYR
jgi:glutamyl/glutaminyl-tRNA synthetase